MPVSSTINILPVDRPASSTSSTGNGASQRRSITSARIPCSASRRITRRHIGTPLPNVIMIRIVSP
jgi:hypothetical protein